MKTIIIILLLFSIFIFSEETYIQKDNAIYKIELNDNGDTLKIEKVKVLKQNIIFKKKNINDSKNNKEDKKILLKEEIKNESIILNDKPLYSKYIKVNWETALLTFPIGFMYGNMIAISLADHTDIAKTAAFFNATMPILMFYLPVKIINENEVYSVTPFIKDGYYRGVYDYFMIASIVDNMNGDKIFTNNNIMVSVISGFFEAWGGYYIAKKNQLKRRTGLFYSRGGLLGDAWGLGLGAYLNSIYDFETYNKEWAFPAIVLSSSFLVRGISSFYANSDKYHWYSKDADIILLNTVIATSIPLEIILRTETDNKHAIFYSLEGTSILSTIAIATLMEKYDIHFNDGNSLLMITGAILGTFLGSSVYLFFDSNTVLPLSLGALAGEMGVFYMLKDKVHTTKISQNMNFNIYPDYNSDSKKLGIKCNFSYNF